MNKIFEFSEASVLHQAVEFKTLLEGQALFPLHIKSQKKLSIIFD